MRQTSEKYIERKLADMVKAHHGLCIKLVSCFTVGLPDRMCLFPGAKIAFVELKATGKKPRKSQILIHEKLRSLGFRVEVIDTTQGVIDFIESMTK